MCTDPSLPVSPAFHPAPSLSLHVIARLVLALSVDMFPLLGHILLFPQPFPLLPLQFTMAMLASLQIPLDHADLSALHWRRDDSSVRLRYP